MTATHAAKDCGNRGSLSTLLGRLEVQSLRYFIENQLSHGLVLDRQRNHGRRKFTGLCSLSATGMGLIALAIASTPEHKLITRSAARKRIKKALRTALTLKSVQGMMPHFVDARTLEPVGSDTISTIDSAWLFAGALWAAEYFGDDVELSTLANTLYERVDWQGWSNGKLLHHGADANGNRLQSVWDLFNAETAFMYVLGIGAPSGRALTPASWNALTPRTKDLGLFVSQYSLALLDGCEMPNVGSANLLDECVKGVHANFNACVMHRGRYRTFNSFWGLSAGDGPCDLPCLDAYRPYSPEEVDGTAHILATVASVDLLPELVAQNLAVAELPQWAAIRGRYGYSNVNVDRNFVSRDVVGIDVGAAFFAIDNALYGERIRKLFMRLQPVRRAVRRIRSQK